MNDREGAIAHSTGGRALRPDVVVRHRLLFDVFTDAVFGSLVAPLDLAGGAGDEPWGTEAEDVLLVFIVFAAGDEAGLDQSGDLELPAALAAAAEEEFSDGHAGGEHE